MADQRRIERLQSVIQKETAGILTKLNDPRLGPLSVTRVKLSKDLRYATIFVHLAGTEAQQRTSLRGLQSAASTVQHRLGNTLELRFTPQVRFQKDESMARQIEMDELFKKIANERQDSENNDQHP